MNYSISRRKLSLLLFLIPLFSQAVIISGVAPSYAGKVLYFYSVTNFVTKKKNGVGQSLVGNDGVFRVNIALNGESTLYIDLESYLGILHLEDNLDYQIVLPPYKPKTDFQKVSTFFSPEIVNVGVLNGNGRQLNKSIQTFNEKLYDLLAMYNEGGYLNNHSIEKIKQTLDSSNNYDSEVFIRYKKYQYAALYDLLKQNSYEYLLENYLSEDISLFEYSFQDFMQRTMRDPFSQLPTTELKIKAQELLWKGDVVELLDILSLNQTVSQQVAVLLLAQALYVESKRQTYPTALILQCFSKLISMNDDETYRHLLIEISEKIQELIPGSFAPLLAVYNLDNEEVSLSDRSEQYTYLNFVTLLNPSCLEELRRLKQYQQDFEEAHIRVVTVFLYDSIELIHTVKKREELSWTLLYAGDQTKNTIEQFEIRHYPSAFIISPQNRILYNPAPTSLQNLSLIIEQISTQ